MTELKFVEKSQSNCERNKRNGIQRIPKNCRWSAKLWYSWDWGIAGVTIMSTTKMSTAISHRDTARLSMLIVKEQERATKQTTSRCLLPVFVTLLMFASYIAYRGKSTRNAFLFSFWKSTRNVSKRQLFLIEGVSYLVKNRKSNHTKSN